MNTTSNNAELVAIATEGMEVFRAEMEAIDRISNKISRKTARIIRIILVLLGIISIYLVFLTFSMSRDLSAMIDSLDEMYVEFGSMSGEMRQITTHVRSMGQNIHGMPTIATNMQNLNTDVGQMLTSIESVNTDLKTMDTNVGHIGGGTSEMAHRFQNVQRAMNVMQYDVNNMLRPMTIMPR